MIVPLLVKEADPVVPLIGLYKLTLENCKFKFIDPETRTSPKKLIRQDKLGEMYSNNTDLSFMMIQDRSLYLLQQAGIKLSEKEYFAIKLHDGLYDDTNKPYYISFNPESKLRSNITFILHQADFLASKVEYDRWKQQGGTSAAKVVKTQSSTGKKVNGSESLLGLVKQL